MYNKQRLFVQLFVFGAVALLGFGCNLFDKPTVPQEKFIPYYIDMLAMQDSLGTDTQSSKKIMKALNERYHVTEEQVQNTLLEMNQDPKIWEKFFDKVNEELTKRATKHVAPVQSAGTAETHAAPATPPAEAAAEHNAGH